MADTSVFASILDAMNTQVAGLGLTFNATTLPVQTAKLPRAEQLLAEVPIILISPDDRPETREPWSSENEAIVKYRAAVVIALPGNSDFTETNLDELARFREQVSRLFQWGLTGATLPAGTNLFFGQVLPEPIYDRGKLAQQYEYSGISFSFWTIEGRTN